MTREIRNQPEVIVHTRAELEAERDAMRAATKGCVVGPDCGCHFGDWDRLRGALFLLGEDVPEVPPRWTEDA